MSHTVSEPVSDVVLVSSETPQCELPEMQAPFLIRTLLLHKHMGSTVLKCSVQSLKFSLNFYFGELAGFSLQPDQENFFHYISLLITIPCYYSSVSCVPPNLNSGHLHAG